MMWLRHNCKATSLPLVVCLWVSLGGGSIVYSDPTVQRRRNFVRNGGRQQWETLTGYRSWLRSALQWWNGPLGRFSFASVWSSSNCCFCPSWGLQVYYAVCFWEVSKYVDTNLIKRHIWERLLSGHLSLSRWPGLGTEAEIQDYGINDVVHVWPVQLFCRKVVHSTLALMAEH